MTVWDNQQATSWFVGILEGEGSFYKRSETNKRILIPNNDLDVIKTCEKFLADNLILYKTYQVKAGTKIGYKITITDVDCKNLYTRILQDLQCRLDEFQRILGASETECNISANLHWLVGIFEAEGSFCISENHRGYLTPKIEIDNTNEKIVGKVIETIKSLSLSWYVKKYFPEGRKPFTKVSIQGTKRCLRFLQQVSDWRTTKNVQRSKVMVDYCTQRLQKPINSGYDSSDYNFRNTMLQLNG